jgi:hypothetical protein
MSTGKMWQAEPKPRPVPRRLRGFGVSNGRRLSMDTISVTVSHNDTAVTVTAEGGYSPDLLDDMCRRATGCLVSTLVQLLAAVDAD